MNVLVDKDLLPMVCKLISLEFPKSYDYTQTIIVKDFVSFATAFLLENYRFTHAFLLTFMAGILFTA